MAKAATCPTIGPKANAIAKLRNIRINISSRQTMAVTPTAVNTFTVFSTADSCAYSF